MHNIITISYSLHFPLSCSCPPLAMRSPLPLLVTAALLVELMTQSCHSFTRPNRQLKSTALRMSSATEFANKALRQSPSSTQFYTHKMCPYAQKVWIALEAGGCPYEMTQIDLYGAGGKPDFFLELNPDGEVPVVTCYGGAKILIDSEYILTRIADGVVDGGECLRPPEGENREELENMVEAWRKDMNTRIKVVGKEAVLRRGKNVHELKELLKEVDRNVVGPYLCGETISLADCSAFPFLWRIDQEFGPFTSDDSCGHIRQWLDKCAETDAFKKTIQSSWWWWW